MHDLSETGASPAGPRGGRRRPEGGMLSSSTLRVASRGVALAHWRILTGLLVVFNLVVIAFVSFTPYLTATIDKSAIAPEIGVAYSASLPHGPGGLYQMRSDTNASRLRSRLVLTE